MNASQELAQIINDLLKAYPPAVGKALADRISQIWKQMIDEQTTEKNNEENRVPMHGTMK